MSARQMALEALKEGRRAMRAPLDGWKGELERPALDMASAAIAALEADIAAPQEPAVNAGVSARKIALEALKMSNAALRHALAAMPLDAFYRDIEATERDNRVAIAAIEADLTQTVELVHCPNCPDQGWYGIETGGCGPDGEHDTRQMEQVQCEFCYMTENSVFNAAHKEPAVNSELLENLKALYGLAEFRGGQLHEYKAALESARAAIARATGDAA